jgi:hypothetical protein
MSHRNRNLPRFAVSALHLRHVMTDIWDLTAAMAAQGGIVTRTAFTRSPALSADATPTMTTRRCFAELALELGTREESAL